MAQLPTSHITHLTLPYLHFVVRSVMCLTSLCVGSQECVGAAEQACPFWCRPRTRWSVWWASTSLLCPGMGSLGKPQPGSSPGGGSSGLQLFIPEIFSGIFWKNWKPFFYHWAHLVKKQSVYIINTEIVIPVWKLTCQMAIGLSFFVCWSENTGNFVLQAVLKVFSLSTPAM